MEVFIDAVKRVAAGGTALDPEVVARMLGRRREDSPLDRLSPRERDVLAAMAEGKSNRGIAEALFVSQAAVEKHITSIFEKLELKPRATEHRRVLAVLAYLRRLGPAPSRAAQRCDERVPPPGGLSTLSPSVECGHAIVEPDQSRASVELRAADAVVADLDAERAVLGRGLDLARLGAGVLDHVGECLADDEVGGRLDRRRKPLARTLHGRPARARATRAPRRRPAGRRGSGPREGCRAPGRAARCGLAPPGRAPRS